MTALGHGANWERRKEMIREIISKTRKTVPENKITHFPLSHTKRRNSPPPLSPRPLPLISPVVYSAFLCMFIALSCIFNLSYSFHLNLYTCSNLFNFKNKNVRSCSIVNPETTTHITTHFNYSP